jgi:hypothetical protein
MNKYRSSLLQELYEERSAIMEFDGGLSRADAERLALEDVIRVIHAQAAATTTTGQAVPEVPRPDH